MEVKEYTLTRVNGSYFCYKTSKYNYHDIVKNREQYHPTTTTTIGNGKNTLKANITLQIKGTQDKNVKTGTTESKSSQSLKINNDLSGKSANILTLPEAQ